jgi:hypothetical protein
MISTEAVSRSPCSLLGCVLMRRPFAGPFAVPASGFAAVLKRADYSDDSRYAVHKTSPSMNSARRHHLSISHAVQKGVGSSTRR